MSAFSVESARTALSDVAADAEALEVFGADLTADRLPSAGQRRRATRRGRPDPVHRAALFLNRAGVLEWRFDAPAAAARALPGRRGRAGGATDADLPDGDLVDMFEFETLDANSVGVFLSKADLRFNDRLANNARMWHLAPPAAPGGDPVATVVTKPLKGSKKRLVLVHGTFSQSQALVDGIRRSGNADAFYKSVFKTYDEVLAFEHPTLAVSPVLNALDLHRELAGIDGPLDLIAHSRGGLVTRWAIETFGLPATSIRAVLVGSPLGGTSLASPPRLRATLGLLTNIGTALKGAGALTTAYAPFLIAPLALLKVATSVVGVVANSPVIDCTIAMIPGLAAQSRVGNNAELTRLRVLPHRGSAEYYVVTSDFQPEDPGWRFWKWFRGRRIANAAADKIFPGSNDLVVDTDSMSDLPGGHKAKKAFGANATVHHTNYFEQPNTLSFIMDSLKMK
jgi:hypothetical protein